MASDVEIANGALTKLAAQSIVSLSEDSTAARAVALIWDRVRRDEIGRYPWLFAMARRALPANGPAPAFGFEYAYTIPLESLRLVEVGSRWWWDAAHQDYQVEGGAILTDQAAPLNVRYVQDIEDTGRFDPAFVEVLVCRLAMELAEAITGNMKKVQLAAQFYDNAVRDARRNHAIQTPPRTMGGGEPWLAGRSGWRWPGRVCN